MDAEFEEQFERGLELFNAREFYDCHDTIEEIWLQEASTEQPFLQGIIQAAVAFHHHQQGKLGAARSMLRLAIEKLQPYPEFHQGVAVHTLLKDLRDWEQVLSSQISRPETQPRTPKYPKIERGE